MSGRAPMNTRAGIRQMMDVEGLVGVVQYGPPLHITAGSSVQDPQDQLPIVLVVCVDSHPAAFQRVVEYVYSMQLITRGFKPVLLTDRPAFELVRPYGWPLEFIMDEAHYLIASRGGRWEEAVVSQTRRAASTLGAAYVLVPEPDGVTPTQHQLFCRFLGAERMPLDRVQEAEKTHPGPNERMVWSGWAGELPAGGHRLRICRPAGEYLVDLGIIQGSSFCIAVDARDDANMCGALLNAAWERGWSTVQITPLAEAPDAEVGLGLLRLGQELSAFGVCAVASPTVSLEALPSTAVHVFPASDEGAIEAQWNEFHPTTDAVYPAGRTLASTEALDDLLMLRIGSRATPTPGLRDASIGFDRELELLEKIAGLHISEKEASIRETSLQTRTQELEKSKERLTTDLHRAKSQLQELAETNKGLNDELGRTRARVQELERGEKALTASLKLARQRIHNLEQSKLGRLQVLIWRRKFLRRVA